MSNWIKITKAKQLRYKLISVMYLIFIALSIINIPIEWLHVNKFMAPLLTETTIVSIENEDLNAVYQSVEQTKSDFYVALGYDEASGTYREPFGYSVTDAFFISEGRGKGLQTSLQSVHEHADRLGPKQLSLFNDLFAEDLENGLLDDDNHWIKWKFKHVPASMAETLLNELVLRVRLISGDLEFKGGKGGKEQPEYCRVCYELRLPRLRRYFESEILIEQHQGNGKHRQRQSADDPAGRLPLFRSKYYWKSHLDPSRSNRGRAIYLYGAPGTDCQPCTEGIHHLL